MKRVDFLTLQKIKCGQKWWNKSLPNQYAIIISEPESSMAVKDQQYEIEIWDLYSMKTDRTYIEERQLRRMCYLKQ